MRDHGLVDNLVYFKKKIRFKPTDGYERPYVVSYEVLK